MPADIGGHFGDLRPVAPGHGGAHITRHGVLAARLGRRHVVKPPVGRRGLVPALVLERHPGEFLQHGHGILVRTLPGQPGQRPDSVLAVTRKQIAVAQVVERIGQVIALGIARHIAAQRLGGGIPLPAEVELLRRGERQRIARQSRQVAFHARLGGIVEIGVHIALRNVDLADRLHRALGLGRLGRRPDHPVVAGQRLLLVAEIQVSQPQIGISLHTARRSGIGRDELFELRSTLGIFFLRDVAAPQLVGGFVGIVPARSGDLPQGLLLLVRMAQNAERDGPFVLSISLFGRSQRNGLVVLPHGRFESPVGIGRVAQSVQRVGAVAVARRPCGEELAESLLRLLEIVAVESAVT